MLADFIELGIIRVCFSLGGRSEALSTNNILTHAWRVCIRFSVQTVLLNILRGSDVSKPLGLGELREALGPRTSFLSMASTPCHHHKPFWSKEEPVAFDD